MRTNEEQYRAIHHGEGPMMVLAGPGAGKTFVITNRAKNLITEYGIEPSQILVVTFSKAAADEMKERFSSITDGAFPNVTFGTFHSVFFRILRNAYHYDSKDVATDALRYRLIGEAIADTGYEVEDKQEFLEDIEKEISRVKGDGIDIDNYYCLRCPEAVFRDIYRGYQERLLFHRALDFDDMVLYTYELLTKREDILNNWRKVYRYILIDEFQDINRLQYECIRLIGEPEKNIFIVGDDDQSIYGFRGARPDIMLDFPKDYPDVETVTLNINYRSSSEILRAAGRLIGHNNKRYKKSITSSRGSAEGVHIGIYNDLLSEAEKICDGIRLYLEDGISPSEIAVLFRTNIQMRIIAGKLMDNGIEFSMKESIPNIFNSFIGRDIRAYLEIVSGDTSRDTYLKIINRPLRYISRNAFTSPNVDFSELCGYYMSNKQYWMLDRINEFYDDIMTMKKMTPLSAIHFIRKDIGYDDFLKERALERGMKSDDWIEIADEIEQSASGIRSIAEWLSFADGYEEQLRLHRRADKTSELSGIRLMTMHGAKGLEFEVVFIPTIIEGISPYRKAVLPAEVEEERRMLYVAMTRAKHHLHLSYVKKRYNKKAVISRFLKEIDNNVENEN